MKKTFLLGLFSCLTLLAHAGVIQIIDARGWLESAFVNFTLSDDAKTYNVYMQQATTAAKKPLPIKTETLFSAFWKAQIPGKTRATSSASSARSSFQRPSSPSAIL